MDATKEFFLQHDGYSYTYDNGYWWKIEAAEVDATPERPAGLKYSLAFFDDQNHCLVRFDNSHSVKASRGKGPVAFDHWHRFSRNELVPYEYVDVATLLEDFFKAIDAHLSPELRSSG